MTQQQTNSQEASLESVDADHSSEADAAGPSRPFLVAAVGASAGGLEAFTNLIKNIPATAPLALVLVQHLARDQDSQLPEILSKRTALRVVQARDEQAIEPAHVYVIPPDAHITAIDGRLRIRPRPEGRSAPVDVLFRSFAQTYREKAVGIVLTGADSDGSLGLREIKAAGGITIAQEPEEARMDSMPKSAISTGAVDMVLPAEQIAVELVRLSALPLFREPATTERAEPPPHEDDAFTAILRLLRRTTGIDFGQYKKPTISRGIARRMALRRVSQLGHYLALLQEEPREMESLQEDVLIHVTSFFREPDSFSALADQVFPKLLVNREDPLRIWVPGCSTGEEVYSLAIALFEAMQTDPQRVPIQLFGTDVSNKSIGTARLGLYPATIAADVSPERLLRYFTRVEDSGYRIARGVRECCVFARQNLTGDPPFSKIDLIVCRNTLIYLGQAIQRKVMSLLHYALKPAGYLMLGRAETVGRSADLFSVVDKSFKLYAKKSGVLTPELPLKSLPDLPLRQIAYQTAGDSLRSSDIQGEGNRLLLERYAPPSMVIDSTFQIVCTRGQMGEFFELPTGDASRDALKVVRDGLLVALRSALQEASNSQARARREGLVLEGDGAARRVNLDVTPFGNPRSSHYLVLFESDQPHVEAAPRADGDHGKAAEGAQDSESALERLRRELVGTRQRLRANVHDLAAANEELQSANEEILSSNEELQSTNEELDTAKEELQSTNEELSTLNEELQSRNEQLTAVNNDLGNLLASVQIPIVMISKDLKIRRFTPAAERVLNLIPTDSGRPIGHLNPNIASPDLESLIAEVIETTAPCEREVEDRDGRAYSMQVRPYWTLDNRIDGAVFTLFDISSAKDALVLARETGEAIMSTVREPILLLNSDLRVARANQAFCEQFQMSARDTQGRFVYDLGQRAWDIPELRRLLENILPEHENFQDFPMEHVFPGLGRTKLLLDGRRIEASRARSSVILLVIRQERGVEQ